MYIYLLHKYNNNTLYRMDSSGVDEILECISVCRSYHRCYHYYHRRHHAWSQKKSSHVQQILCVQTNT